MALTARQRVLATLRREPADCVPVAPFMYDLAAVAIGMPLLDYYSRADCLARAQLALQDLVGHDLISVGSDNYYIAEGFGCQTTRSRDELPSLIRAPLNHLSDVFDLQVPDPAADGRMPMMLDAIRQVRAAVGQHVAIRCPGTGPFALASYLLGSQEWLLEVALAEAGMPEANEAALHHALDLASDALIRFGQACWDAGADIIQCGDSLSSCDVISPRTYQRFAQPYQQKVFRAWREYGITGSLLHICGDSTQVLERYRDTGADLIEIDNKVDLGVARQRIGDDVILAGNVHTVTDLLQGTPDTVAASARRCIQQTGGRGFILGSGCLVPRHTPLDNVRAMVQVAHDFQP
jgi:uroporphyrinogen decarboxylase